MSCHRCHPPKRSDLCPRHLAAERRTVKLRLARADMTGRCRDCRNDAEPGKNRCAVHLEMQLVNWRKHEALRGPRTKRAALAGGSPSIT